MPIAVVRGTPEQSSATSTEIGLVAGAPSTGIRRADLEVTISPQIYTGSFQLPAGNGGSNPRGGVSFCIFGALNAVFVCVGER